MKTEIHSERYIMLSEMEGIPEEVLNYFETQHNFVLDVCDRLGQNFQSFFEVEAFEVLNEVIRKQKAVSWTEGTFRTTIIED